MAMNTLSALQYLKVCLGHMEVEPTTRTRIRSVTRSLRSQNQKHRRTREFKRYKFGPKIREGEDTNLSTLSYFSLHRQHNTVYWSVLKGS